MKLYFGSKVATLTTLMVLVLIAFIVYSIIHRNNIQFWGRRTLFLTVFGLVICCYAATRDGLDKTIQYAIDGSVQPGIFPLISVPNIVGCVGAAIVIISGIISIFCHKQNVREILFYMMSGGIAIKILTVEIARLFV